MPRLVDKAEFYCACDALWSEIQYQNCLPRRTDDEAKDVAGFLTLLRCYLRKTENDWESEAGEIQPDGQVQATKCLHGLRKIAAIALRAMIYNGIRERIQ